MKALMDTKKIGIAGTLVAALFLVGCGSDGGGNGGGGGYNPNNPGNPPVTDPIVVPVSGGVTVDLTIVSKDTLDDYTGFTTNAPTEAKLILNLKKVATYTKTTGGVDISYGGTVAISFKDLYSGTTTQTFKDTFSSLVNSSGVVSTNKENHKYNLLTGDYPEMAGQIGYHGFFEDQYGAVILVIDSTNDLGDGQGPTTASGSIYFKNHGLSYAPKSPTSCWFVSVGPYDCRTWKSGDKVQTKRSIYPESNYTKLGTFNNLDIKKAFNQEI